MGRVPPAQVRSHERCTRDQRENWGGGCLRVHGGRLAILPVGWSVHEGSGRGMKAGAAGNWRFRR